MKTKIVVLIILIFSLSCSKENETPEDPVPEGWVTIDSPVKYKIFADIEFYDNNFGVICGGEGNILITENGGNSWSKINTGSDKVFVKIFILNENEFYFSNSGLYHINKNENSFIELGNLSSASGYINGIHFFDSENGVIFKNGRILKTNDGGSNWIVVCSEVLCNKMQFVSDNIGYVTGGASWDGMSCGDIHKTTDGGNSWTDLAQDPEIYDWEITGMQFMSVDIGYMTNYKKAFYITQDGGSTWNMVSDSVPEILVDIVFLNQDNGYGLGLHSIYMTEDGGLSWTKEYENKDIIFSSITVTPDKKIFAVGNGGILCKKDN